MRSNSLVGATLALVLVMGLTGCGDARFKKLSVGITRDSVAVLSGGAVPHRTSSYLTGGKAWQIDFFSRKEAAATDTVAWREMTPVVYENEKVAGWGWGFWDKTAKELNIPVPK